MGKWEGGGKSVQRIDNKGGGVGGRALVGNDRWLRVDNTGIGDTQVDTCNNNHNNDDGDDDDKDEDEDDGGLARHE